MANSENKRLAVDVIARIDKLEKGMAKAASTVDKRTGDMEKRTAKFASNFESNMVGAVSKVNGALASLGFGGLAAGGIAGLVAGFKDVASGVADIGAEAQRAGLSTKAFQELKYAAEQSRVTVDALTDGMKELSLRTDEFIVSGGKSGSAAQAFQRLGLTVDELKEKIKDPSALLTEIIGKVQQLDKAAQVRIFDELFGGTGGEQFVRFIDAGEAGLRANIQAANELGIVIDDQVIKRAAEVDAKFNAIAATIGGNLKAAIVDAFSALSDFVDAYRDVQNRANSTLDTQIADLGKRRLEIETKILEIKDNQNLTDRAKIRANGTYEEQLRGIADQEKKLVDERNKRIHLQPVTPPAANGTYKAGATPTVGAPSGGSSAKSDPYESFTNRLREHTAALQAETTAQAKLNPLVDDFGRAAEYARTRQELLSAAQRAGKEITPELAASIDQLADGYAAASAEAQRLQQSQESARRAAEDFKATGKDVLSGFISDMRNGVSAADALTNALNKVVDKLIDVALNAAFDTKGGGGIGSLFSNLFGGGGSQFSIASGGGVGLYADGGYTGMGGKNEPAGIVHKGEYVMDAAATKRIGVENLRKLQGYANGGYVGTPPSLPNMRAANNNQQQVAVTVRVDNDGNLKAFVQRESAQVSAQVVQATAPSIIDQSTQSAGTALGKGKFDSSMSKYGVKRQANVG